MIVKPKRFGRRVTAPLTALVRPSVWLSAVVLACSSCGPSHSAQPQPARSSPQASPAPSIDWPAVERALGAPLQTEDQIHRADIPRDDLHVTVGSVPVAPGMGLATEINFLPTGAENALLVGEMTVLDSEKQRVVDALQRGGLLIAAIHKHQPAQTPDLWWMHFVGYGDAVGEASALHTAVTSTATPLPPPSTGQAPLPDLDVAGIDGILGTHGKIEDGAYQANVPVTEEVTDTRAHVRLPAEMQASTALMFQPMGGNQVAANGDFALTADQVNPVVQTLRQNGIDVISLHNHMLYEQPRLFYLHYWATGDALTLARGLRAALDRLH